MSFYVRNIKNKCPVIVHFYVKSILNKGPIIIIIKYMILFINNVYK